MGWFDLSAGAMTVTQNMRPLILVERF